MSGVLVAFIIFVLFPGIILGFILLSRYLRFKETQTMIEHGITPPQPQPIMPVMPPAMPPQAPPMAPPYAPPPYVAPQPPPMAAMSTMPAMPPAMPVMPPTAPPRPSRAQLTWGLVLTAVGIALTLALWPIGLIANSAAGESGVHFPLGLGPWMLAGFIPLFVGLALILAHVISQPERGVQSVDQVLPPLYANGAPAPAPRPMMQGGTQTAAFAPPAAEPAAVEPAAVEPAAVPPATDASVTPEETPPPA
jgi:hypothetical protein